MSFIDGNEILKLQVAILAIAQFYRVSKIVPLTFATNSHVEFVTWKGTKVRRKPSPRVLNVNYLKAMSLRY